MSGRRYALIAAACLFVLFVASNLVANIWLKSARIDLTANRLYSLSPGTREVLRDLSEPVELKLFFSRDVAARDPTIQAYGARVRELLQSFAARSRGRIRFVEINPKRFTEAEDEAETAGVEPIAAPGGGDPLYFGLVGSNAVNDQRAIPAFSVEREPFIEYEVTRLLYELENPDRPKVALITSLPIDPAFAQFPQAEQFGGQGQSLFATELGRFMDVQKLDPTFIDIPADVDVLAILHPYPLTPAQLYAIDQFILSKGRAFIALDPASLVSLQAGFNPMTGPASVPPSSSLEPLLSRWGVAMTPEVVLDLSGALPVQAMDPSGQPRPIPQPVFFRVEPDHIDREDLTTAWLQRGLIFGASGAFSVSERPNVAARTLASTSGETMRIPAQAALARPSPIDLLRDWVSANRSEIAALRLSGTLDTAYPSGPPPGATASPRRLLRSARPAEVVLVADSDFLADDFYVSPQQAGATWADNGAFALNVLDILTGSDAMVSLRSRAPSLRRMTLIDRMEAQAQARIEQRQSELQNELQRTEARLQELQSRGQGSGFFAGNLGAELTREERAEMDRFKETMTDVRQKLRATGRDLRSDIDRLQAWATFVNVWLAPILVAAAGIFVFWRRRAAKGPRS